MGLESFCTLCKFSVMVDGIWLVSVMVDGKYKKYSKMSALQ